MQLALQLYTEITLKLKKDEVQTVVKVENLRWGNCILGVGPLFVVVGRDAVVTPLHPTIRCGPYWSQNVAL